MNEMLEIALPNLFNDDKYPSQEEYNYWASRQKRIFYIDYEIDENYSLVELGKSIIQLNIEEMFIPKELLKPIYLFIYSSDGDLAQTYGIIGIIEASRIPVITVNMGVAMSAGFLLLLSGHKRYTFKHSNAMVHQGRAGFSGTPSEIEEAQKSYNKQLDRMKAYILSRTHILEKEFNKKRKNDWYLTDNEQLSYGVVDGIITDFGMLFDLKEVKPNKSEHKKTNTNNDRPKHYNKPKRPKGYFEDNPDLKKEYKE